MAVATSSTPTGKELAGLFDEVHLIRSGAQFIVFGARERGSGRPVACKVPHYARAAWVHELVLAQAALLQRLAGHPHVLSSFGTVTLPDGRPVLVLDRCAATLAERYTGVRLPLPQALATGIKIAGALDAVHRAGWLHCDVRTANVLLDLTGEPVLGGFDEAVATDPRAPRFPRHTITASTAPELLEDGLPLPASDVYGLAAALYELIAGQPAFRQYDGESAATVIVRVLGGQVQPIVEADVPFEVSDLLTWALSADAAKRPPTPAWFAEELARLEARLGLPRTPVILG